MDTSASDADSNASSKIDNAAQPKQALSMDSTPTISEHDSEFGVRADVSLTHKPLGRPPIPRKLSTSTGIRVKLVHRDSTASSSVSSPIRSPVPKSKSSATTTDDSSTEAPQVGDSFPSLDAFHKNTKKWINATYPQYAIYFRSRKGDRPEFYCKYQNSPGASTTPGLGCKFGFNAKRRTGPDGKEIYVVTKVRRPRFHACSQLMRF